jgi:DNA-binding MarR family transcriptional regulator
LFVDNTPDLVATAQCLCLAARRAARAITRSFDQALRAEGLKATQFTLLASLALKGPQPVGVLADFIGLERTTLTRNLAVLKKRGLIELSLGEDARARIVSMTAAGRRKLNRAYAPWRVVQDRLTESMGAPAADGLRRLSRKRSIHKVLGAVA